MTVRFRNQQGYGECREQIRRLRSTRSRLIAGVCGLVCCLPMQAMVLSAAFRQARRMQTDLGRGVLSIGGLDLPHHRPYMAPQDPIPETTLSGRRDDPELCTLDVSGDVRSGEWTAVHFATSVHRAHMKSASANMDGLCQVFPHEEMERASRCWAGDQIAVTL